MTSDHSFNPLTYMVDEEDDKNRKTDTTSKQERASDQTSGSGRESVCTLVGGVEEEVDMSTLTGMLRFVNQTLAMQEDLSLWSSTGRSETGSSLPLQVTILPQSQFDAD